MKIGRKYGKLAGLAIISVIFLTGCGSSGSFESADLGSGNGGGISFTNEYSSPSELGAGDIMYVNFDDSNQSAIDFSGVAENSRFVLVVGSAAQGGNSSSFQLSSDVTSAGKSIDESVDLTEDADVTADEILSTWLRAAEYDLALNEQAQAVKAIGIKASSNALSVGDVESFRVLSSLNSTAAYTNVDGEVRCIGDAVVFYVDPAVSSSDLSDADVESLCHEFDGVAKREMELLGSTSDINGDGRISILMTPQINRLGSLGGGIITGYFWAGDLYPRSSANPVSNEREIIYTMVPDPNGVHGAAVTKEFTLGNLLPAVFPHELQHAISYNQHVIVNNGSPEQNWLNEGASHLAEDLMGFGQENASRYALYLSNTAYAGLVTTRQPNLYERGAAYLFLRYLYEQAPSGDTFVRNLVSSSMTGVENLENAFGGSTGFSKFHELLARWTVALALTNEGVTQDARYIYRDRVMNSATGHWEGVCLKCDADDGRGTILDGVSKTTYFGYEATSVAASAAQFYDVSSVPAQIVVDGGSSGQSFGVLMRVE